MCQQTHLHTCYCHITLVNMLYSMQCGFSISYVSIPGITAHDRCNISHVFTFSFQLRCGTASFIYLTIFGRITKLISVLEVTGQCGFIIICFKIGLLNFSPCFQSLFLLVLFGNNWHYSFICVTCFLYQFWFPYSKSGQGGRM